MISSFESSNFWYLFPFWFLEHLFSGESFKDRVIVNFIASKYEEEISSNGKKFNFAETGASKELHKSIFCYPCRSGSESRRSFMKGSWSAVCGHPCDD